MVSATYADYDRLHTYPHPQVNAYDDLDGRTRMTSDHANSSVMPTDR